MGLNNVNFIRGEGGLGRPLAGEDYYSGMIFYTDTLPTGFSSGDRIKKIFSVSDAEALGIVDTHADETKATGGNVLITAVGATGSTWSVIMDGAVLGSYVVLTADTVDLIAAGLRSAINALTYQHGYSAADATANVLLTAPAKKGKSINAGSHLSATNSGAGTSTITQFTEGVGSFFAVMHYHISEFFRMQPDGVLWIGLYPVATYTGAEIQTIQDYTEGKIRNLSVFVNGTTFASSQLTASQTYATINETNYKPLSVLFHADMTGLSLSTIADISGLTCKNVSCVISEDGNWFMGAYSNTQKYIPGDKVIWQNYVYVNKLSSTGKAPFNTSYWTNISTNLNVIAGHTISTLGNALGCVAVASVHECIAWVNKFNISDGYNLDVPGFSTGVLYKNQATALLNTLNTEHYVFNRNFVGKTGTYYNDSWTAIASTSDYCTIENNRTIDKAVRGVRVFMLPHVARPIYVNEDGTISEGTIAIFKNSAERVLDQMERDEEISAFKVIIDPTQNVLSTSKITIKIQIVPVGVAREIEVNIGFTVKIN